MRIFGFIEAGQRVSKDRGFTPGWVQDVRFDASTATRLEVLRRSRWQEWNSPVSNRLASLFVQYTVGPKGLRFTPASSSDDWNRAWSPEFAAWSEYCDRARRQNFVSFQQNAALRWYHDGEFFIYLTRGQEGSDGRTYPRLLGIETHRVGTPGKFMDREGVDIHDGIEVDVYGRPLAYYVSDTFAGDTYRRIPAEFMVHIFEPSRPGQLHGHPFCTPVLLELEDLRDLQLLEMRAAKLAASIANVLTTKHGNVPSAKQLQKVGIEIAKLAGSTSEEPEERQKSVQRILGGETVALYEGEDLKQFKSDRPSVVTQAYWDFLVTKICSGVGIDRQLAYPVSIQGTVARANLDVSAAWFRSRSAVLQSAFGRVYNYVTADAVAYNPRLPKAPADFRTVTVRPPRSPNVDIGRNSQAMLNELAAGVRTLEGIWGEDGEDYRERGDQSEREKIYDIRRKARLLKATGEIAKAEGVDPEQLRHAVFGEPPKPADPAVPPGEMAITA